MSKDYSIKRLGLFTAIVLNLMLFATQAVFAQTSEFTYQGKFPDAGGTASGNYQMEFKLFDAATGGSQIGTTISIASVPVTKSVFSVTLDFGYAAFPGADRYLEIATRKTSGEPFTLLGPRQKITSAPYSMKSKSADTAGFALFADTAGVANRAFDSVKFGGQDPSRFVRYDNNDNVGIGTASTGAKLSVAGTVESKSGGFKFPDATTQSTAGITSVATDGTITGSGTPASPLGISSPLMVRDLDNPARQPFAATVYTSATAVTVPPGKRLVIETISGISTNYLMNITADPIHLSVFSFNDLLRTYYVVPAHTKSEAPTHNITYFSQSMRIYLLAGERLFIGLPVPPQSNATVSGYWIDVP